MEFTFILLIFLLSLSFTTVKPYSWYDQREIKNPLKLFGKCVSDHECEFNQYCDHTGINPVGACKIGAEDRQSCVLDRYCRSKNCNLFKCLPRDRVRDGKCYDADHNQCVSEQYCSHIKEKSYNCKNRKCHGSCTKDAHCLTNVCRLFRCKRPQAGCQD
jgi:hypothetical protein